MLRWRNDDERLYSVTLAPFEKSVPALERLRRNDATKF